MSIRIKLEDFNVFPYEPSRFYADFHVAGFAYYDGLEVIDELTLGKPVDLVAEPSNPHDPDAVAIVYNGHKIGYIPSQYNRQFSTFLLYGHGDVFEARIQSMNKESHPERQFRVVVKIKDNRPSQAKDA